MIKNNPVALEKDEMLEALELADLTLELVYAHIFRKLGYVIS